MGVLKGGYPNLSAPAWLGPRWISRERRGKTGSGCTVMRGPFTHGRESERVCRGQRLRVGGLQALTPGGPLPSPWRTFHTRVLIEGIGSSRPALLSQLVTGAGPSRCSGVRGSSPPALPGDDGRRLEPLPAGMGARVNQTQRGAMKDDVPAVAVGILIGALALIIGAATTEAAGLFAGTATAAAAAGAVALLVLRY